MSRAFRGWAAAGCAWMMLAAGCATTRGDAAAPTQPAASAPRADEPFAEFAKLPAGPKVVEGYAAPAEATAAPIKAEGEALPPEPATGAAAGSIARPALERFLGEGPSYALALVQVQPSFQGGRFEGFQIVSFSNEGQSIAGSVLKPGDVVVRINRRAISRPEDYMAAWESLKGCAEVTLQIVRQGQTMELIFPIEG